MYNKSKTKKYSKKILNTCIMFRRKKKRPENATENVEKRD